MSPRPPHALLPRDYHRGPDEVRALAALGLTGHDPVRGRFLGNDPRIAPPRLRLRGLVDRILAKRGEQPR